MKIKYLNKIKYIKPFILPSSLSVALVVCAAFISGCGYKLVGGGRLPGGVQTVCVSIFENRSAETGVENQLAGDLNYEFTRNGIKVFGEPSRADALLTGTIKSVSVETASYTGDDVTMESRVTVVVDARLKDKNGQEIWSADNVIEKQTFTAVKDKQANLSNKKDAISKLSRRFAESFYGRLTEDF